MENPKTLEEIIKIDNPSRGLGKYLLAGTAALIIISEVIFLFWFVPGRLEEVKANSRVISDLEVSAKSLEEAVVVLDNTNTEKLSSDLALAELALPSEKRVTGLVSGLTNLASSSGTVVNKIEISFGKVSTDSAKVDSGIVGEEIKDVPLANDVVGVPMTLEVEAEALPVLDLVGKIQEAMPLLGIKEVEYSVSGDKKSAGLSVLIYSQPGETFKKTKINKILPLTQKESDFLDQLKRKTNILQ